MSPDGCPFCPLADTLAEQTDLEPGHYLFTDTHGDVDVVAFPPLDPVTPGHTLIVPRVHVPDAAAEPQITARVAECAAQLAAAVPSANLITSIGAPATQTVAHLHIHLVPREPGDDLPLPWTPQQRTHRGPLAAFPAALATEYRVVHGHARVEVRHRPWDDGVRWHLYSPDMPNSFPPTTATAEYRSARDACLAAGELAVALDRYLATEASGLAALAAVAEATIYVPRGADCRRG